MTNSPLVTPSVSVMEEQIVPPRWIPNWVWQRYQRFIRRRSPPISHTRLSQRNIYIFLSKEGWLYAVLLVITFIAGVNYANNLVLGLCFYLASILVIHIHYTFAHLSGLQLKVIDLSNAQVGSTALLRFEVAATGSRPHRQVHFEIAGITYHCPTILEAQQISLNLPADRRGKYVLPRLKVSTIYPMGIIRAWSYIYFDKSAWVWPAPITSTLSDNVLAQTKDSEQELGYDIAGQEDFSHLDDYQTGESLSRVSWRHVARGQGMLSKVFSQPAGEKNILDYQQMTGENHEVRLGQLSYLVRMMGKRQQAFALHLPNDYGKLGQGDAHVTQSLIRLAKAP